MNTIMAECEVCGTTIRGEPKIVQIDGAPMRVCEKCAKLGVEIHRPRPASRQGSAPRVGGRTPGSPMPATQRRPPRDVLDMMEGDIVDDFAERIRNARNEKGLSQKDLAMGMKEKEGLVKKIEKGMIPEERVRKKIESVLGINLLDRVQEKVETSTGGKVATTLGDVMSIKRSK